MEKRERSNRAPQKPPSSSQDGAGKKKKTYDCSCGETFLSLTALNYHNQQRHELTHRCSICEASFSRPWLLRRHRLTRHQGEKDSKSERTSGNDNEPAMLPSASPTINMQSTGTSEGNQTLETPSEYYLEMLDPNLEIMDMPEVEVTTDDNDDRIEGDQMKIPVIEISDVAPRRPPSSSSDGGAKEILRIEGDQMKIPVIEISDVAPRRPPSSSSDGGAKEILRIEGDQMKIIEIPDVAPRRPPSSSSDGGAKEILRIEGDQMKIIEISDVAPRRPPSSSSDGGAKMILRSRGDAMEKRERRSNRAPQKPPSSSRDGAGKKRKYACVCGEIFRSLAALNIHKKQPHDLTPRCSICGVRFTRPWLLRRHHLAHHAHHPEGKDSKSNPTSGNENEPAMLRPTSTTIDMPSTGTSLPDNQISEAPPIITLPRIIRQPTATAVIDRRSNPTSPIRTLAIARPIRSLPRTFQQPPRTAVSDNQTSEARSSTLLINVLQPSVPAVLDNQPSEASSPYHTDMIDPNLEIEDMPEVEVTTERPCGAPYSSVGRPRVSSKDSFQQQGWRQLCNCGKRYSSRRALLNHLRAKNPQHCCRICGKRFARPYLMREHMMTHSEDRNYLCLQCGGRFRNMAYLTKHIRTVCMKGAPREVRDEFIGVIEDAAERHGDSPQSS